MARITTKTGIANMTAVLLKTNAVTTIDPPDKGSKFARLANSFYDEARRQVYADAIWDHALERVSLAADTNAPAFGRSYKYLLPADYIRVATINDEFIPETDYEIEKGYIVCDFEAPLNLRYVFDQEDITLFPPKFLLCVARKLAALIAYDVTGNRSMVDEMEGRYMEEIGTAKGVDAQQNPPKRIQRSKWAKVRQVGSSGFQDGTWRRY